MKVKNGMNSTKRQRNPVFHWEKAFTQKLFRIALPIAVQNLVTASAHIVDGLMIAGLGDAHYAAVSQAGRYSFLFQLFLFGAASGSGIFISQFWGKKNPAGVKKVMLLCLRITVGLALLFMLGAMIFPGKIMDLFLAPGQSHDLGMEYLQFVSLNYLLAAVDIVFSNTLRATEKPKVAMMAGIAGIAVNTFLNYCLIYGNLGFPMLGVRGAAIATVIAAGVSLCVNAGYTYLRHPVGALHPDEMGLPSRAFIISYLKRVIPVVLNEGLWALGMTVYAMFYGRYSDAAVSAIGVYNTIDQLMTVFIFGAVNATAILIGKAIGADDRDGAFLTARRMLLAVEGLSVMTGVFLIVMRFPLLHVYNSVGSLSAEAIEKASVILFLAGCVMPFRHFNTLNVVGVLRAGGDTVFSMLLDAGLVWIVGVPCVAIATFVLKWPIEAVFLTTFIEEFFKISIGLPRFLSGKWIHNLTHIDEGEKA